MKKIIFLLFITISYSLSAQVGVNTETPQANFHIKGSGSDDILRIDTVGKDNSKWMIKASGNVGINTNNPTKTLHVKDGLVVNNITSQLKDTINYRNVLVADANGNTKKLPFDKYFIREQPNIRSAMYVSKSTELNMPNFHPDSTIVKLGVLSVRYNYNGSGSNDNFIEFKVDSANYASVYYKKAGTGTGLGSPSLELRFYQNNERVAVDGNTWVKLRSNFNADYRDLGSAIILLNNTKHIYRITLNANGSDFHNSNPDNVVKPNPQITIFLEQILNELL